MPAADADVGAANGDIALRLRVGDGVAQRLVGRVEIDNLALAHAAGIGLPNAQNAGLVSGHSLGDDHADLGGADFQTDDDGGFRHTGLRHDEIAAPRIRKRIGRRIRAGW